MMRFYIVNTLVISITEYLLTSIYLATQLQIVFCYLNHPISILELFKNKIQTR